MEDYNKLQLYKKGLELTKEEIKLEEDFLAKHGRFSTLGSPELMEKLKEDIAWYNEKIAILESSARDSLREKYKGIETLDRLLEVDEKGVFWLNSIIDGKIDIDECLGRNDDKYTLAILPKELHKMTPNDGFIKVKVIKEVGNYKSRKVTKQVFIDADF